jgi:hypothetical protein
MGGLKLKQQEQRAERDMGRERKGISIYQYTIIVYV